MSPPAASQPLPDCASTRDLIPPLAGVSPRLRFHKGGVANNRPLIVPELPNIPAPVSPYYVVQWHQKSFISPETLRQSDPTTFDPRLGIATYAFEAPDGHAHVWIYPYEGGWLYELYEAGGYVDEGGGSNIFLATDAPLDNVTFDAPIFFEFEAKLSKAAIHAEQQARDDGAVVSQIFAGFEILFRKGDYTEFSFMQLPIAVSRPVDYSKPQFFCKNGKVSLFSPALRAAQFVLPFVADAGPLHRFRWRLNDYIADTIFTTACGQRDVDMIDLRRWSLTGFYIGLETENRDARTTATTHANQGVVETGLQLANLRLYRSVGRR